MAEVLHFDSRMTQSTLSPVQATRGEEMKESPSGVPEGSIHEAAAAVLAAGAPAAQHPRRAAVAGCACCTSRGAGAHLAQRLTW